MDRYNILIGTKPPKQKKVKTRYVPEPELERIFYLGDRRSGKTSALLGDMMKVLSQPTTLVAFCSHSREAAYSTIREFISYLQKTFNVYEIYSDFERRIHANTYGNIRYGCIHGISAWYLDNIDDYEAGTLLRPSSLFEVLSDIRKYPVPRIVASCDRRDFSMACELMHRSGMGRQNGLRDNRDSFSYMGIEWKIVELPLRGARGIQGQTGVQGLQGETGTRGVTGSPISSIPGGRRSAVDFRAGAAEDILIFYGETEEKMKERLKELIGPLTEVREDE